MLLLNISDATSENVTRSKSPEFDDSGAESAETVELNVSKTPPARHMTLRSATKTPVPQNPIVPTPETNTAEDPEEPQAMEPSKPSNDMGKGKKNKGKKRGKHQSKRQKKFVTFTLPNQRNIRKDMVDENCARLKIKYKQWSGDNNQVMQNTCCINPILMSTLNQIFYSVNVQRYGRAAGRRIGVPGIHTITVWCATGMCILCPLPKNIFQTIGISWDRHYNGVHIRNLIVVENTTALWSPNRYAQAYQLVKSTEN